MPETPNNEEVVKWHRYFAVECNNLAWRLSEADECEPAQEEEMLAAAYAAALHWRKVGTDVHVARAELLLARIHSLLSHAELARRYAVRSFEFISARESPAWELAFAHAIRAHAASLTGERELHAEHYSAAKSIGEALDAADRDIFLATFRSVPVP